MIQSPIHCEGRSETACCLCDLECYFRVADYKLDGAEADRLLEDTLETEND